MRSAWRLHGGAAFGVARALQRCEFFTLWPGEAECGPCAVGRLVAGFESKALRPIAFFFYPQETFSLLVAYMLWVGVVLASPLEEETKHRRIGYEKDAAL